mmetsp:Transcript_17725/g.29790  ORF Transcript_17725/g.29790 Transcript_17725/m.29790 type:complete len:332 (+) Transcript_17725:274-1269(+)
MKSAISMQDKVVKSASSWVKKINPKSPSDAGDPVWTDDKFTPDKRASTPENKKSPRSSKNEPEESQWDLKLDSLPRPIAKAVELLDWNGDGNINVDELTDAVMVFNESKKQNRMLRKLLILASVFLVTTLAANFGLVFAVVYLTKETSTQGDGVMTVAGTDTLVRVGSAEMRLNGTAMTTNGGKSISTSQAPLKPMPLTSTLPNEALDELKMVKVKGDNKAFLSLTVLGWVRIPAATPGAIPSIKIVTQPGHILIDGNSLSFEDLVGRVFADAGFSVDGSSTSLLTLYELTGLYNSDEWEEGVEDIVLSAPASFGSIAASRLQAQRRQQSP